MPIHRSQAPNDDGYFVSMGWLYTVLALVILIVFLIIIVFWQIWNMSVKMEEFDDFTKVTLERRRANDEMLTKRARVQQWTFSKVCEDQKAKGRDCLDNPEWWANPNNYPLLKGESALGTGLFPPDTK